MIIKEGDCIDHPEHGKGTVMTINTVTEQMHVYFFKDSTFKTVGINNNKATKANKAIVLMEEELKKLGNSQTQQAQGARYVLKKILNEVK